MNQNLAPASPPSGGSPAYRRVKSDLLAAVDHIRAAMPAAADYLEKHLSFDDEKETVCYTGDDRLKLTRL